MSIELILNAVNINLLAFALCNGNVDGQVFALYIIAVAAAEVGVGLAMVLLDLPQPPQHRPRRALRDEGLRFAPTPSMWFLDNAWLIPVIPAVAFC